MAEKQLEHRQTLEYQAVTANIGAQKRGVWLGFTVAMLVILGGLTIIFTGHSAAGLVAVLSALTALVGVFIYGRKQQRRELDQKTSKKD